jgi:hypothetical protein
MRKRLLLAAALGALAIIPAPASAYEHGSVRSNVESSLGIRIIVRDGPKVVHQHHHPKRHLRPQPWRHHFSHRAPSWRWHKAWHHQPRHFQWRDHDHRRWFHAPRAQHFKHGDRKPWQHFRHDERKRWMNAPSAHGRPAVRNHFRHDGFEHGRPRSDRHRHRD